MTEDEYELGGRVLRELPEKPGDRYSTRSGYLGFNADHDTELVLGSIFGLRGWDQDRYGRLCPVAIDRDVPFTPGVNVAKCFGSRDIRKHNMFDCSCGYYAYFSDASAESRHGSIGGIIEATGVTVIGTQGFRAEKAELKALIVRPELPVRGRMATPTGSRGTRPVRWLSKWLLPSYNRVVTHKKFDRMNPFYGGYSVCTLLPSAVAAVVSTIVAIDNGIPLLFLVTLLSVLGIFWGMQLVRLGESMLWPERVTSANFMHSYLRGGMYEVKLKKSKSKNSPPPKRDEGDPDDPFSVARLRVLYPGVPIFYSLADATREFPLTKVSEFQRPDPPLPSPLNTDNFWSL